MSNSIKAKEHWNNFSKYVPDYFGEGTSDIKIFLKELITGRNLNLFGGFQNYDIDSVELDVSDRSLKYNQSRDKVRGFYEANSFLPFKDNSFDSATIISGWQYIDNHDSFLKEMERVLKPGKELHIINGRNLSCSLVQTCSENPENIASQIESFSYDYLMRDIPSTLDAKSFYDELEGLRTQTVLSCITVAMPNGYNNGSLKSKIENKVEKAIKHIDYVVRAK